MRKRQDTSLYQEHTELRKRHVYAINDISLSLKSGQFVLIVGSSGSGKSTLLNIMGMLDRPTSGVVFIDGMDSRKLDEDQISALRNKKIGFIFQFSNLLSDLTVIENVILPRQIAENEDKARDDALDLLSEVGLKNQAYKRANSISEDRCNVLPFHED